MNIVVFLAGILLNTILGGTLAAIAGLSPVLGSIVLNAAALAAPWFMPSGAMFSGVFTEVWTGEMIKQLRIGVEALGWLSRIRRYDQYAKNNAIHFVELGGSPDVLINNTTYPIPVQTLDDADKTIGLDKYQTKATPVTDDELHAISYDRMASVLERHRDQITESKYVKALHALAPAANSAATPVLLTTGDADAEGQRKMVARQDIIALKRKFDAQKLPAAGRVLVLCSDHVNDLLESDQKFKDQYHNYESGKIGNLYGFEVYEFPQCPRFKQDKTKIAFESAEDGFQASVAFYAPQAMQAAGETKAYLSDAKTDPQNQQNLCNYRHYYICLPLKNAAIGAIASAAL